MLSKIYENLSQELIAQRKFLRISRSQLAELIGTTERTLRDHENNNYRDATVETMIKIAEILEEYRKQRTPKTKRK